MRRERILDGEGPEALSARVGAPVCMILRANRLAGVQWLTPGREIAVPEGDFCAGDAFPCPVMIAKTAAREKPGEVCIAAEGETIGALARAMGTTERLMLLARGRAGEMRGGERIVLDGEVCGKRIGQVMPGETLEGFCKRHGLEDIGAAARLNRLEGGRVWPGMRLILPG